ncbi:MAG: phosphotransferase [Alphaproteobacteria bacterium]
MTAAFLKATGFGAAQLAPLPSDASARRYTRLLGGPRPALLMEAPPPEDTRAFIAIAGHILGLGLSAPEIIAADPTAGLVLLEDFGDATHAALLDSGAHAPMLYAEAAETLAALHEAAPPPGLPAWDAAAMARATAATFLDWCWPAMMGSPPCDDLRAGLDDALRAMLIPFASTQGFVHRDYFPANLMRHQARRADHHLARCPSSPATTNRGKSPPLPAPWPPHPRRAGRAVALLHAEQPGFRLPRRKARAHPPCYPAKPHGWHHRNLPAAPARLRDRRR